MGQRGGGAPGARRRRAWAHASSRVRAVSPVCMKWGWGGARRGRGVPFRAPVVLRTRALVAPARVRPKRSSQNVGDYLSLINSVLFILFKILVYFIMYLSCGRKKNMKNEKYKKGRS